MRELEKAETIRRYSLRTRLQRERDIWLRTPIIDYRTPEETNFHKDVVLRDFYREVVFNSVLVELDQSENFRRSTWGMYSFLSSSQELDKVLRVETKDFSARLIVAVQKLELSGLASVISYNPELL